MEIERRLFIGNLPSGVDENLIRNRFSKHGKVLGVELKQRKATDGSQKDEILSTFAFINISAKKEKLDICLRKLSKKKWDGQIIKIDFAKESVLSRLERERKELSLGNEPKNTFKETVKDDFKSRVPMNGNGNNKWFGDSARDYNGEKVAEEQKRQYPNNKRKVESDQLNNKKIRRFSESTVENGTSVETTLPSSSPQTFTPEQRRLKSLEEKMKVVSDRKLAVKAALSSVDSGSRKNKIIFKDDDDDDDNGGDDVNSFNEPENRIYSRKQEKTPEISNPETWNRERNNLFDDSDESDEETPISRFEIKEHFDGKKGQKLLKLQSKYGNDSRFALDRRFAESSSSDDDDGEDEDENKATREETRPDVADEDSGKMHVDNRDDDEVNRQLEILQNVVGHQIIKPPADDHTKPKKQKPGASGKGNQLCVRFDPTIVEHEKFIVKPPPPPGSEEENKVGKKRKNNKHVEENVDKEPELDESDTEASKTVSSGEVSKETYYEVASDLKERLKSSGTGFSLSQLFSSDNRSKNDENDRLQSSHKSKERDSTVNKQSVSSEKNDVTNSERMVSQSKTSGFAKLWKESFFFKDHDDRFQEGADFFMKNNDDASKNFSDRRQELKLTVRNKMRRVMRKDRMFKKKIGGGCPSKTNKFSKKGVGR